MLLIEVALHVFRALEPEAVVRLGRARGIGVPFDFDVGAARLRFQLLHQLVEIRARIVGHRGLAELEVPLVLTENDLVHQALGRLFDLVGAGVHLLGRRVGRVGTLPGGCGTLIRSLGRSLGTLIDFPDTPLVGARALLSLFDSLRQGVDLVVDLPDLTAHELLRGACTRPRECQRQHRNDQNELLHHCLRVTTSGGAGRLLSGYRPSDSSFEIDPPP